LIKCYLEFRRFQSSLYRHAFSLTAGALSQGENRKDALANIKEAIEGYLEAFPEELDHSLQSFSKLS
jgi:predicted RNase H-like HicB family nuclease